MRVFLEEKLRVVKQFNNSLVIVVRKIVFVNQEPWEFVLYCAAISYLYLNIN